MLDAPGVPPDVVETGREHGARCDQREGGCTGGRGPPVGDRDGVFQPLSWSVGPRAALVVMDCRRRSTPGYIWGTRSAARKRLWKQPNGTVARLRGAAMPLPALGSMPAQRWSTGAFPARLHRKMSEICNPRVATHSHSTSPSAFGVCTGPWALLQCTHLSDWRSRAMPRLRASLRLRAI